MGKRIVDITFNVYMYLLDRMMRLQLLFELKDNPKLEMFPAHTILLNLFDMMLKLAIIYQVDAPIDTIYLH